MFADRKDAGRRLAGALHQYRDRGVLLLAIPKGGIEVGKEIADRLEIEFSIIITRKLPFPDNPEAGFGAIAEDGSIYMMPGVQEYLPQILIDAVVHEQQHEIERRIDLLRLGLPLPDMTHRTVILVDDGIAAGSTMRVSVQCCRNCGAGEVIVAAPVSSVRCKQEFMEFADGAVILETPPNFRAVADAYRKWYDVSDEEALQLLEGALSFSLFENKQP